MGIWSRIKSLFGGGADDPSKSAGALLQGIMQSGLAPRRGTAELLDAYRTHPWLRSVIARIATEVATTRWKLYKTPAQTVSEVKQNKASVAYRPDGATEIKAHPLLALLDNPSPVFTRTLFFMLVEAYLSLKGEAVIVLERGANGMPVEMWVVPPHWMAELPHAGYPSYRFSWGAWQRTIPERDVIFLKHPDLLQPYGRGIGQGEALADEVDIDEFATKHLKSWFFNRALPDVFLSVEGVGDEAEAKRYEEKLKAKHGGRNRAFQVHVTSGKVDLKQVGHTFREQMLPEIRAQQRDVVLQVFGVPPEIMGIVENSNRATIDAAVTIFTRFTIAPRSSFMADGFTAWARREYQDGTLSIGFDSPVPEDAEFALKVMVAQPDLFTKNEWRKLAGKEPQPGWDNEFVEAKAPLALGPGAPGAEDAPPEDDPAKEEPVDEEDDGDEAQKNARAARRFLRVAHTRSH